MVGERKRRLFLASPYGFSATHADSGRWVLRCILTSLGADVRDPRAIAGDADRQGSRWAWLMGQAHTDGVRYADGLFAVVNGSPPDEGVMIEVGMAIGLQKPVFLFRDDRRRCGGDADYPLNLMLFAGCGESGWRDFWYTSVEGLGDPAKGLMRWLRGEEVVGPVSVSDLTFDDGIPF